MNTTIWALIGSLCVSALIMFFVLYPWHKTNRQTLIENGIIVYYMVRLDASGTEQGMICIDEVKDNVWTNRARYLVSNWGRLQTSFDKEALQLLLTPVARATGEV